MGMSANEDNEAMSEINVTPFVDVMLVLLVIFMVTAPMMTQGVQIDLPNADAANISTDEKGITLSVSASGEYYMAEEAYSLDELLLKLQAIAASNPAIEVYIRADGAVQYERVAQLMVGCTNSGITKIGMITEPEPPSGE